MSEFIAGVVKSMDDWGLLDLHKRNTAAAENYERTAERLREIVSMTGAEIERRGL